MGETPVLSERIQAGRSGDGGEHPAIPVGVQRKRCVVNDYLGTSVAFDFIL